jgi:hypothetical protein
MPPVNVPYREKKGQPDFSTAVSSISVIPAFRHALLLQPSAYGMLCPLTNRVRAVVSVKGSGTWSGHMILPVKVPITTTSAREKTAGHISRNDSKIKAFAGISATSETGASAPQPDGSNFATNIAQE